MIFSSTIIVIFQVLNWIKFYLTPWFIPVKKECCQKSLSDWCALMPVIRDHRYIMNLFVSWKVVILPVKQKHFFYSSLPVTIWHICVIISGHSSVTSSNLHVWRYTCTTQQSKQNTGDAFNDNFVFHIHLMHVRTLLKISQSQNSRQLQRSHQVWIWFINYISLI